MAGIPASILYLRDIFGGDFEEKESNITVGTVPTRLTLNDPECVSLLIINLGSANVYIKPSNTVATTSGIILTAGGGNASMDVRSDATLPSKEWWAISGTAGQDLYVLKIRRYVQLPGA